MNTWYNQCDRKHKVGMNVEENRIEDKIQDDKQLRVDYKREQ